MRMPAGLALALTLAACSSSSNGGAGDDGGAATGDAPSIDVSIDQTAPDAAADKATPMADAAPEPHDAAPPDAAPPDTAAPDAAPADTAPPAPDAAPDMAPSCGPVHCDCTFQGRKMFGKVKYVAATEFPDVTVRVVTIQPDLYVEKLTFPDFATKCGQWLEDKDFPDFKVHIADLSELPQFEIQFDDFRPGLPNMR